MIARFPLTRMAAACGLAVFSTWSLAAPKASTPGLDPARLVAPQAAPYLAPPTVFVPDSSREQLGDAGRLAHTNYMLRNVNGVQVRGLQDLVVAPPPQEGAQPDANFSETPASLACLAGVGKKSYAGCTPITSGKNNAIGGSGAIAIVIAYDNPTVASDLAAFSAYFKLPAATFTKIYANGNGSCSVPPFNAGWALESALDTQWSHAMAPGAQIILVEACSNSYADLMYAEQVAQQALLPFNGGQVSNSWSSGEWSTESSDWDWVFRANWVAGKPITTFFSAGDAGLGAQYPSSSPWVVSVGGTTVNRDGSTKYFQSESCWAGSGGGTSSYETWGNTFGTGTGAWTAFQYPWFGAASRRTPDIAFDADPASGAYVLYNNSWYVVGGTSLSAPAIAGIVNNAGNHLGVAPSAGGYFSNMENNMLYAQLASVVDYPVNFYDVTSGSNGAAAGPGWDYCTGVGSPRGRAGK